MVAISAIGGLSRVKWLMTVWPFVKVTAAIVSGGMLVYTAFTVKGLQEHSLDDAFELQERLELTVHDVRGLQEDLARQIGAVDSMSKDFQVRARTIVDLANNLHQDLNRDNDRIRSLPDLVAAASKLDNAIRDAQAALVGLSVDGTAQRRVETPATFATIQSDAQQLLATVGRVRQLANDAEGDLKSIELRMRGPAAADQTRPATDVSAFPDLFERASQIDRDLARLEARTRGPAAGDPAAAAKDASAFPNLFGRAKQIDSALTTLQRGVYGTGPADGSVVVSSRSDLYTRAKELDDWLTAAWTRLAGPEGEAAPRALPDLYERATKLDAAICTKE